MNENNDLLRKLFMELPDEPLPSGFGDRLALKMQAEAVRQKRKARILEWGSYLLCGIVMVAAIVFALYISGCSFEMPDMKSYIRPFKTYPIEMFKSPSFAYSLYIGTLVFLLLVVDSMVRRHFRKKNEDLSTSL